MANRRVKGEGTISRRKDGRKEAKLSLGTIDGKRIRKSFYGRTRLEAAEKLRATKAKKELLLSDLRVVDHLDLWLRDGASRWEAQTYRSYSGWLRKHVVPYFGERKVSELAPADIRAWLRQMDDKKVGAPTRKRALSTLRSALKVLVDDGEILRNPCDPVKGPKIKRKDFHVPSPLEVRALLQVAKPYWLYVLLLLAFTCTMREGELFALYWDQVDLNKKTIFVNKNLAEDWNGKLARKTTKNKHSVRTIFLPSPVISALANLKKMQRKSSYNGSWVFPDRDGGPLRKSNFLRREYRAALDASDLPYFRFYALRHAGNSLLIAQGEDALSIAKRMGHADTRMTFDTYGHLFEGAGKRAADSMEKGLKEFGIQ